MRWFALRGEPIAKASHVLIVLAYRTLEADKWQSLLSDQMRIVTKNELTPHQPASKDNARPLFACVA